MSLRTALTAAVVLGLGGIRLVAWIGMRLPPKPAQETAAIPVPVAKIRVLAAARTLRAGALLKHEDIETLELPAADIPANASPDTAAARAELTGSMIRRALQPKDMLLPTDLVRPGDRGFLAAVLRPGMRATTIGVDAVSGTAGLIWPGDRVDAILTQVADDPSLPVSRRASAETLLGDVRVIAIDQQLMQGATGAATERGTAHTVTLEVTEGQAERLALENNEQHQLDLKRNERKDRKAQAKAEARAKREAKSAQRRN